MITLKEDDRFLSITSMPILLWLIFGVLPLAVAGYAIFLLMIPALNLLGTKMLFALFVPMPFVIAVLYSRH